MATAPVVKTEADDIEGQLMALVHKFPNGFGRQVLQENLPHLPLRSVIECLNELTKQRRLEVLQTPSREILWKPRDQSADKRLEGLDTKEVMLYEQLRAFGNKGASAQQLQNRCSLPQREVSKCLNSLEAKRLVKTVRPAGHQKKKIFMLSDLEPDASLQAGTFFSGEGFDQEFVDILCRQCEAFLRKKSEEAGAAGWTVAKLNASSASLEEIHEYIRQSKVSTVALGLEDIGTIMRALVSEGAVEARAGQDGARLYRTARPLLPPDTGAALVPCLTCPVAADCRQGGEISPAACPHLADWARQF